MSTGNVALWTAKKFESRLFLMRELFQQYIEYGPVRVCVCVCMCVCVCVCVMCVMCVCVWSVCVCVRSFFLFVH